MTDEGYMEITSIRLTDYRNYRDQTLDFAPGINVLAGGNAQGKTNMLEAVRLCSIGRSHRTPRDRELIREGTHQARIALKWRKLDGCHDLAALLPDTSVKQIRVDGKLLRRSGELMGMIATVLFAPEDLMLVKSGPGERRRFMDMELSQIRPVYYYALQRYNRAPRLLRPAPIAIRVLFLHAILRELPIWACRILRNLILCNGHMVHRPCAS